MEVKIKSKINEDYTDECKNKVTITVIKTTTIILLNYKTKNKIPLTLSSFYLVYFKHFIIHFINLHFTMHSIKDFLCYVHIVSYY
jgi:hypothetical protein